MTENGPEMHFSDAQLLAWLDGDRSLAQDFSSCEPCRQRALALHIEERRLRLLFFRAECPSTLLLAEYGMGLLSKKEKAKIDAHIIGCPHCSQELAWQRQFMASLAASSETALQGEPHG